MRTRILAEIDPNRSNLGPSCTMLDPSWSRCCDHVHSKRQIWTMLCQYAICANYRSREPTFGTLSQAKVQLKLHAIGNAFMWPPTRHLQCRRTSQKIAIVGASAMSHTHLSTVSQERFWLQELLLRSLGGLLRNGLRCECDECQGAEFFGGFPNQTRFHRLEIGKWPRKLAEFGNLAGSAIKVSRHTNL